MFVFAFCRCECEGLGICLRLQIVIGTECDQKNGSRIFGHII